jgi:hypothetical protein
MRLNIGGSRWFIPMIFILGIGSVVAGWALMRHNSADRTTLVEKTAVFSLKQSLKSLPQWERYQEVTEEIRVLREKLMGLGIRPPSVESELSVPDLEVRLPSAEEMGFKEELSLRVKLLQETMRRWDMDLKQEMESKLNAKNEQLNQEIKAAVVDQEALYSEKLQALEQEFDLEYSLKIANIDFKLSIPGLSGLEIEQLKKEKEALEQEKVERLQTRKDEYHQEIEGFISQRNQAAQEEISQYITQLEKEAKHRRELQQIRLKDDFEAWRKRRLEEIQQSASSDVLDLNALEAERERIRLSMVNKVRRNLREIAKEKGLSVIVGDPLFFRESMDLTPELLNLLK